MYRNIVLVVGLALLTGCGGNSTGDGTIGPSSSDVSRISVSSVATTKVDIEAVKSYNTEGVAVDIALSDDGKTAYIASGDAGFEIIDISAPSNPRLLHSYDLPEYVNYVEVEDDVVYAGYIAEGYAGYYRVDAFDVYNPYNPTYIGTAESQNGVGHNTAQEGEYLYQVGSEGLEVFQEDGTGYTEVGSYYLHDSAYALALHHNYVFIANGRAGLTVLKTNAGIRSGKVLY